MKVFNGIQSVFGQFSSVVVTVGNFDGVHKGHQELLKRARRLADSYKANLVALTFNPHPLQVLQPERALKRLFSIEDLTDQLEKAGVDGLVIIPFDKAFSQQPPEYFFSKFIRDPNSLRAVVVGYDFTFGSSRTGGREQLRGWVEESGAEFVLVDAKKSDGETIYSSTEIRESLLEGDVVRANYFLGRPYFVQGTVVHGDRRGRTIGFPTANIALGDEYLVPKPGVYLTKVFCALGQFFAVTNIGVRPTFSSDNKVIIEAHLLDCTLDLYDMKMKVELLFRIRNEIKFSSKEGLIEQIQKDIMIAREKTVEEFM